MRLEPVNTTDAAELVAGELRGRAAAPGWPHRDTAPGLSFAAMGGSSFLIIDDDERIAGECGTKRPPDRHGMVEIGYGLAAPSRGQRLGSRAVAALVEQISQWPPVRVIEAEVHVSNTPSRRVVEGLGFAVVSGPDDGFLRYRRSADQTSQL